MVCNITSWILALVLTASPLASSALPFFCGPDAKACCCKTTKPCEKPVSIDVTFRQARGCCPDVAGVDSRVQLPILDQKRTTFEVVEFTVDLFSVQDFDSTQFSFFPPTSHLAQSGQDRIIITHKLLI